MRRRDVWSWVPLAACPPVSACGSQSGQRATPGSCFVTALAGKPPVAPTQVVRGDLQGNYIMKAETHQDKSAGGSEVGTLRIAGGQSGTGVVFHGQVSCPHCRRSLEVEVSRNPKAISDKQPAFLIKEAGNSGNPAGIGHLFLGTILTSPVLYYGALNHCGPEQRVSVFYNRALRDPMDAHLLILKSTSKASHSDEGRLNL
jgi:hypothetical protein